MVNIIHNKSANALALCHPPSASFCSVLAVQWSSCIFTHDRYNIPSDILRLRLRNHLFRQRLHRIEYHKEECTDVSWRFLLRPLGVAITKTTSWNAKIYIYIKPESKVYK